MGRRKGAGGGGGAGAGGLGQHLIRDRFKGTRFTGTGANERQLVHSSELDDGYDWGRLGGVSVTEQGALDDFLATAELAGTDFTAEKLNVHVVTEMENEALPSLAQRSARLEAQRKHRRALRIPRRPEWTRDMSAEQLQERERLSFLEWRRSLSELQDNDDLLLTPFERNLDFWRQLWRVIERSDVIVQIVDARNPLLFRCPDLEVYVKEVDAKKKNLLLINKADLLTPAQREQWTKYFTDEGINFVFFSASLEAEKHKEEMRAARDGFDEDEEDEFDAVVDPDLRALARLDTVDVESRYVQLRDTDTVAATSNLAALALEDDDDEEEEEEAQAQGSQTQADQSATGDAEEDEADGEDEGAADEVEVDEPAAVSVAAAAAEGDEEHDEAASAAGEEEAAAAAAASCEGPTINSAELFDVNQFLELLESMSSDTERTIGMPTIGLVGYPNVGKSSTINTICKAHLVSVSATPGKTKHFQTILLPNIELCDCPGLVFPNFANTKAELVCNGILPVDQLRDVIPPATFITQHIPRHVLEKIYGIRIIRPSDEDDAERAPTAWEFLNAYSFARGFMNARGLPDVMRGGRIVLKDFVKGKLLYCHPPPGYDQLESKVMTNLLPTMAPETAAASIGAMSDMDAAATRGPRHNPTYANEVDEQFFRQKEVKAVVKGLRGVDNSGATVPEKGSKKHYKGNTRVKKRIISKMQAL